MHAQRGAQGPPVPRAEAARQQPLLFQQVLPRQDGRAQGAPRRHHLPGGHREAPLHVQAGSARQLPDQDVHRPEQRDRQVPRVLRNHRKAHARRLHSERPRLLDRGPRQVLHLHRDRPQRHNAGVVRIRPLHWRSRSPLRRREGRGHGPPRQHRQHRETGRAHPGPGGHGDWAPSPGPSP